MRGMRLIMSLVAALTLWPISATAANIAGIVAMLKRGGYVLVIRHGATDNSQKDVYPFVFDDIKKQRQLSEQGRQVARQMGAAMNALQIPLGNVYTSKLNRAIETGRLISGAGTIEVAELTDSGAGSVSAMSNPTGSNAAIGKAIRDLVNRPPMAGTDNVLVTHKTNIADAFGQSVSDVKEGEALIYKPNAFGAPALVGRVQPADWMAQVAHLKH